jgi:hypothetical protein
LSLERLKAELVVKRLETNPNILAARVLPFRELECLVDQLFHFSHVVPTGMATLFEKALLRAVPKQEGACLHEILVAHDERPLDHVAQLAHVTRPIVGGEYFQDLIRRPFHVLIMFLVQLADETLGQNGNICQTVT